MILFIYCSTNMSIQIACHKYQPDKLTKKLLTSARFAHFDFRVTNEWLFWQGGDASCIDLPMSTHPECAALFDPLFAFGGKRANF
jgi:hypothetical protein